ncbi:MAG: putative DNA-binding domain-containing protein [Deltaproteobacteria bacterium]|nr:putative DNA-binding domain-containing protein [Deltaproteobacteria bacterium]MBW2541612.1 putative DNA-binding domain-containing protein [Deltaproteobacteria bacterium]
MQPSLAELQRALAARILSGEGPELDSWVCVPPATDSAARVAVYVDGYPARIREALRESFPAVAQILGDGSFAALADRFAKDMPAELQNLNLVGAALPRYLESDRVIRDLPFLPALAELEWAVDRCFHADLLPPFDPSPCSGWSSGDWARARIGFQPGLGLVCAPWPLRELRETYRCERSEIDVDLVDRHDRVLVYRRGFDVVVESIESAEAEAMASLQSGVVLGEVTAALADSGAEREAVAGYFGRWASLGLVVSCELSPLP